MNPKIFIEQEDVKGLIGIFKKFASTFQTAEERQNFLIGAGVESTFLYNLKFDSTPVKFAHALLANFRRYFLPDQHCDYHSMICFLASLLDETDPDNCGLILRGINLTSNFLEPWTTR